MIVSYENNLYYNPEASGYEILEVINLDNEPWQFDMLVVWRDPDGYAVWSTDSGCSCPAPFELLEPDDLEPFNYKEIESLVRGRVGTNGPLAMEAEDKLARLRKVK